MKVYRISKCAYVGDLSGTGAALYGGRWNSKGTYLLYTAGSSSLAMLESVVHLSNLPASDYCLIILDIPDNSIEEADVNQLPKTWNQHPPPAMLRKTGDKFVREGKKLALRVPSAVNEEEFNLLLNPAHPDFAKVKVVRSRPIAFDDRLRQG
jgi:RES domain-containing protein